MGIKISNKRYKNSKCYKCYWLNRIDEDHVFCPLPACIKKGDKNG